MNNLENSHVYLKHLHSKLTDLSKDDSIEEDPPEIVEIKNLLHYLREEVAKELTFNVEKNTPEEECKENNQSSINPIDFSNQAQKANKSLDNDVSMKKQTTESEISEKSKNNSLKDDSQTQIVEKHQTNDEIQVCEHEANNMNTHGNVYQENPEKMNEE